MQYLIWPDGTRVPMSDVSIQGDETAFTVQVLRKPLASCFVLDDHFVRWLKIGASSDVDGTARG
jgi:hypothetical protein